MIIFAGSVGNPFSKIKQNGSVTGNGEGVYTLSFDGNRLKQTDVCFADNASTLTVSNDLKNVYVASQLLRPSQRDALRV